MNGSHPLLAPVLGRDVGLTARGAAVAGVGTPSAPDAPDGTLPGRLTVTPPGATVAAGLRIPGMRDGAAHPMGFGTQRRCIVVRCRVPPTAAGGST